MKRPCLAAFVLVLISTPGLVLGQIPPSDDCTPPVARIDPLPFTEGDTAGHTEFVDLSDLSSCAAGLGGTNGNGGDFVYELVLGPVNDVTCTLAAFGSYGMSFVLSTSCAAPLDPNNCLFGEVAPAGGTVASFNTSTLGLGAGTYYVWMERHPDSGANWWDLTCSGNLVPVELQRLDLE